MTKRAKYVGPHLEVTVIDSEASVYDPPLDTVVRNGLLTKDAPARVRDSLLETEDWVETQDPAEAREKAASKAPEKTDGTGTGGTDGKDGD